jgi:cytochrome c oxidase subunit 4
MEHSAAAPAQRPHPNYVAIFGWLTAFTLIEVGLSLVSPILLPEPLKIAALVTLAAIKALLVILYYMHLRYDSKWYALILIVGVGFALLLGRFLFASLK